MERAVLSPTTGGISGMKYVVVPLYTCCISTHLRIEKPSGAGCFLCGLKPDALASAAARGGTASRL
jgi:hypothetical protein